VEKPLATTTSAASELIEAAQEAGRTLMVGHTFEHNSAVWKMRELITSGALGRLYYIDSARLNLGLYQGDVNVIFDLAPHDISIVNYLLGAQPTSVEAWASRHAHTRLEDVAYLRLQYASLGVEANIHVSWLDPNKVRRLTAVGSLKMAVYNDMAADERIRVYDRGVVLGHDHELGQPPMTYRYGDITSPHVEFREPLAVQDEHFVHCINTGERPRTDGSNGRSVVRVLEAAATSFKERRLIDLDEVAELEDRPLALSGATQ
jgi:predicted dehydrogenase